MHLTDPPHADEKTAAFFDLHKRGFGRGAIAAKLGTDLPTVERMFAALEEDEFSEEKTATVGGGGRRAMQGN